MYLWRKTVTERWLESNEGRLNEWLPERVVIVRRPNFERLAVEIAGSSAVEGRQLRARHGGTLLTLKRNWLEQFTKAQRREPLRIGRRLIIFDRSPVREAVSFPFRLVIPSGAAFGTGDHATTAMTLRLLEEATRRRPIGWSLADLGTGSGILSLAAARFNAGRIEAIDNDPMAISTAKANARSNGIRLTTFVVQDVRKWRPAAKLDVIVANLFSELLIKILPGIRRSLKSSGVFIFSGVMRNHEEAVIPAIRRSGLRVDKVRRRGKWIACSGGL